MSCYKVETDPYCNNCPEFEVMVKEEEFYEDEFNRTTHYILRSITCKHRKRCNNMINWLNKNYKEKGDNNGSFTD